MRPFPRSTENAKGTVDYAIVTMKPEEASAVLKRLPFAKIPNSRYDLACIFVNGVERRVAHVRCLMQGQSDSRTTTATLILDLAPNMILLVGIAGTVPNDDVSLGDVVVSSYFHDIRLGANKPGGGRQFEMLSCSLQERAKDFVSRLPAILGQLDPWFSEAQLGLSRPPVIVDESRMMADRSWPGRESWNKRISESLQFHFERNQRPPYPIAKPFPFASTNELTKDPEVVAVWLDAARFVRAIEMESVGAFEACRQAIDGNDVPLLSFRGISDVVGFSRENEWTIYACEVAAAFSVAVLKSGALDQSSRAESQRTPSKESSSPEDLLTLGSTSVTPKLASASPLDPWSVFTELALKAKRSKVTVGWNVRPVQQLGLIHFAYAQQLSRLADWGFDVRIVVYDTFTSRAYKEIELKTLARRMKEMMAQFNGISPSKVIPVSRLLADKKAATVIDELFQIARPTLGQDNRSANDPATSLDNLLCVAVERWQKIDVLLAGGRDANDFWATFRVASTDLPTGGGSATLILDFPKISIGEFTSPEAIDRIPNQSDAYDVILKKLSTLDSDQQETIWNVLLAPCNMKRSGRGQLDELAAAVYKCFNESPYLVRPVA